MMITRRNLLASSAAVIAAPAIAAPTPEKKEWVWHRLVWDDESTRPTEPGVYAVIVAGDSESEGAHVYYDFDDYQTFATLSYEYDDEPRLHGDHDEEPEFMLAWCGPLDLPRFDFEWEKLT